MIAKQNIADLYSRIQECTTEGALDEINDAVELMMQLGEISRPQYKALGEALDDRLSDLVDSGLL